MVSLLPFSVWNVVYQLSGMHSHNRSTSLKGRSVIVTYDAVEQWLLLHTTSIASVVYTVKKRVPRPHTSALSIRPAAENIKWIMLRP